MTLEFQQQKVKPANRSTDRNCTKFADLVRFADPLADCRGTQKFETAVLAPYIQQLHFVSISHRGNRRRSLPV